MDMKKHYIKTTCDRCKVEGDGSNYWTEVEIRGKGAGFTWQFDYCPDCSVEFCKLIEPEMLEKIKER